MTSRIYCDILPRLHEQAPGALEGAGQKGIGVDAEGQMAKYWFMSSW